MLAHHKPDRTDYALDQLARRLSASADLVTVAAEGGILDL
jgi:hypothetical protein